MNVDVVKYLVGLLAAQKGIRRFDQLARRLGISPSHLSNLLACRDRSPRQQLALAKLLGKTPQELFGQYTAPELVNPTRKESA